MDSEQLAKKIKKLRHDLGAPVSAVKVVRDQMPEGDAKNLLSSAIDRLLQIMDEMNLEEKS